MTTFGLISIKEDSDLACEECGELHTHEFRSHDDLINAVQVAAAEVDRGVLHRLNIKDLSDSAEQALESVFAAGALPDTLEYRFQCAVCGDCFELNAYTYHGTGAWTRVGDK